MNLQLTKTNTFSNQAVETQNVFFSNYAMLRSYYRSTIVVTKKVYDKLINSQAHLKTQYGSNENVSETGQDQDLFTLYEMHSMNFENACKQQEKHLVRLTP